MSFGKVRFSVDRMWDIQEQNDGRFLFCGHMSTQLSHACEFEIDGNSNGTFQFEA